MKIFRKKRRKQNRQIKKGTARVFRIPKAKYFVLTFKSFASLLIFLLLVGGVIFFFSSDYFKINDISCEKNGSPCSEKERDLFFDLIGVNIFLVDTNKTAKSIKNNHPWIKEIIIQKKLINKVLVEILEREELAALTIDEKTWFMIDDQGFVFRQLLKAPRELTLIYLKDSSSELQVGQQLKEEEIAALLLILKSMKENLIFVDKISVDANQVISLSLAEEVVASLSAKKEISRQVDSLHFILRQSKIEGKIPKWIDLRFDKPVIKF